MPDTDLTTRLNEASADLARHDLAEEIASDVIGALDELIEASRGSSGRIAPTSHAVLPHLGALCVLGLAESESLLAVEELRELATLVNALHRVEHQMSETATRLLRDTREIPDPPDGGLIEEVTLPTRRICDEAYLMLRRLGSVDATMDDYLLASEEYLNLTQQEQNDEITRILSGGPYTNYLQAEDDDE
jgi:hypothetical protein